MLIQLDSHPVYLSTLPGGEPKTLRSWTRAMWQKLSLRARINLLLALVLALGLAANIGGLSWRPPPVFRPKIKASCGWRENLSKRSWPGCTRHQTPMRG